MKTFLTIYLIGYAIVMVFALRKIYNTEKLTTDTVFLVISTAFLLLLLYPVALLGAIDDKIKEYLKNKHNG